MKHLFIIIFCGLLSANISFAQGTFSKMKKTASDVQSENVINKLSQNISLSEDQKTSLAEITTNYLDGIEELKGQPNTSEEQKSLETARDKKAKKILADDKALADYQKYVNELFVKTDSGLRK